MQGLRERLQAYRAFRELNPGVSYMDWKAKMVQQRGEDWQLELDSSKVYDYQGFYNEDPLRAYDMLNLSSDTHFTDKWKTPLHPTFSDESIYSTPLTTGGHWGSVNGTGYFEHSDYTMLHPEETRLYLQYADPGVVPVYKGGTVLPEVEVRPSYANGGEVKSTNEIQRTFNPDGTVTVRPMAGRGFMEDPISPFIMETIATDGLLKAAGYGLKNAAKRFTPKIIDELTPIYNGITGRGLKPNLQKNKI